MRATGLFLYICLAGALIAPLFPAITNANNAYNDAVIDQIFGNILNQNQFDAVGQRMLDQGEADIQQLQQQLEMSQIGGALSDLQSIQSSFSLIANPTFPAPDQTVILSIDDYSLNSVGATVEWSIDGVAVPTEQNKRSIETIAPVVGESKTISATLRLPTGATVSASHVIKPVQVDIIIEAETHVPTSYVGRSMPTQRTPITATALVFDGSTVNPATYSYRWSIDRSVANGGTVRGQATFTFTPPLRRLVPIRVEVFNTEGKQIAQATAEAPLLEPEVHFYEKNPLRGTSALALPERVTLSGSEMTIQAKPYYFSGRVPTTSLRYAWKVNNSLVTPSTDTPNELTIQSLSSGGSGVVELLIRNPEEILQRVTNKFRVTY